MCPVARSMAKSTNCAFIGTSGQAGGTAAENWASVFPVRRLNPPGTLFLTRLRKRIGETGGGYDHRTAKCDLGSGSTKKMKM